MCPVMGRKWNWTKRQLSWKVKKKKKKKTTARWVEEWSTLTEFVIGSVARFVVYEQWGFTWRREKKDGKKIVKWEEGKEEKEQKDTNTKKQEKGIKDELQQK